MPPGERVAATVSRGTLRPVIYLGRRAGLRHFLPSPCCGQTWHPETSIPRYYRHRPACLRDLCAPCWPGMPSNPFKIWSNGMVALVL